MRPEISLVIDRERHGGKGRKGERGREGERERERERDGESLHKV